MPVKGKQKTLLVTTLACSMSALADDTTTLDAITVTASRIAENIGSIPGVVQLIDHQQLQEQTLPGENLTETLGKLVPSLGVASSIRSNYTQTMRGRRVLFLIDGIPQDDSRQTARYLDAISVQMVERVEVVSGASAVYGSGGAGGIINIITRKAQDLGFDTQIGLSSSATHWGGDSAVYQLGQAMSAASGSFDVFAAINFEQRANAFDAHGNQIAPDPNQGSRADSKAINGLLKAGYTIIEGNRLELSLGHDQDEQDTLYAPDYPGYLAVTTGAPGATTQSKAIEGLKLDEQTKSERSWATLSWDMDGLAGHITHFALYYRQREQRFLPHPSRYNYDVSIPGNPFGNQMPEVAQSISKAAASGLKFTLEKAFNEQVSVIYGLDYDVNQGEERAQAYKLATFQASSGMEYVKSGTPYEFGPDVTRTNTGLFGQLKYTPMDVLDFRAGIRLQQVGIDIADYLPVYESVSQKNGLISQATVLKGTSLSEATPLFNLGMVYHLNNAHDVFANYSEGFETPDYARLLRSGISPNSQLITRGLKNTSTVVSDSELEVFKVQNIEAGWRMANASWDASTVLFYNQSSKTPFFDGTTLRILDQDRRVYGFEGMLQHYLNESWLLGGSYVYNVGESKDSNGDRKALDAATVAPAKLTAFVSFMQPNYNIRLQGLHSGDYDAAYNDGTSRANIQSYTLVDLLADVNLPKGVLSISIKNLLNEDYRTVYSQWAGATYAGGNAALVPYNSPAAAGITLGINYRITY